jgi:prolyl oligopeptidase
VQTERGIFVLLGLLPVMALAPGSAPLPPPPKAHVDSVAETIHGVTITDNYRWLEDQNSPATRAWIAAEQKYTAEFFSSLPQRANIRESLAKLERIETRSVPVAASGKYFFTHRGSAEEQASLYLRRGTAGSDEKLVDPNALSPDHSISVSIGSVAWDGSILAYEFRKGGQDETEVHFLDVNAKRDLPDVLPRARYGFASDHSFTPDGHEVYYSKWLADGSRVYRHRFGTAISADKEIFGAGYGADYTTSCTITSSGTYLFCEAARGAATTEEDIYVQKVGTDATPRAVARHVPAVLAIDSYRDSIYILTSAGAPNGRVIEVALDRPAESNWREIVPQGRNPITSLTVAANKLFVTTLENVSGHLHAYTLTGGPLNEIRLPAAGTIGQVEGEEQGGETFLSFSSFAYPNEVLDIKPDGSTVSWWRSPVPLRSDEIEVQQVWYGSKDGTKVPMFVVDRKGQDHRSRPTLLTGYGGFNVALTPRWSAMVAWWLEQGGVFAMPALRGGGEFGEAWHKAGMLQKKQNVFDDFITAAEYLIRSGVTSKEKLAIFGTSNGGLLVGAAMTQRPDLFHAVVCGAPLLDMVRYQSFKIAKLWVPEYGSSDDPKQFPYILKYSPYRHVEGGVEYPAVLFWTGDNDTRVDPLHARKMTALMQAEAARERPILIRYDTLTGHSGGRSVDQQLDFDTDLLAFVRSQIG